MRPNSIDNDLDGLSILVLEDEFFIAMTVKDFLKQAGAEVVNTVKTLSRAREALGDRFDAAILDVRVPDGTSYDLAKELLAQDVGVVFHSGHTGKEDANAFPNAVFCEKPSMPEELIKCVSASIKLVSTTQ